MRNSRHYLTRRGSVPLKLENVQILLTSNPGVTDIYGKRDGEDKRMMHNMSMSSDNADAQSRRFTVIKFLPYSSKYLKSYLVFNK